MPREVKASAHPQPKPHSGALSGRLAVAPSRPRRFWPTGHWLVWLCLLASPLLAQTEAPPTHQLGNRALLVVETSSAMQSRAEGTLHAVQELLATELQGQLQTGDTLGVWTFSDEVHAGQFPLQHWSHEKRTAISDQVQGFLRSQRYAKSGKLDKALDSIAQLTSRSEFLTVILVTDGAKEIHGTPFDDHINDAYRVWRQQQQETRMPYLTVLRAQAGKFVECAVSPVPWPIDLPSLPPELLAARAAAARPVRVPRRPAPAPVIATGPPLIFSGHKPAPTDTPKLVEPALPSMAAQGTNVPAATVVTTSASQTPPTVAAPAPKPSLESAPAQVASSPTPLVALSSSEAPPALKAETKAPPVSTPATERSKPAFATASTPAPAPAAVVAAPISAPPVASNSTQPASTPFRSQVAQASPAASTPPAPVNLAPTQPPARTIQVHPSAPNSAPEPATLVAHAAERPPTPAPTLPVSAAVGTKAAPAVATAADSGLWPNNAWVVALGAAVIAALGLLRWRSRLRLAAHASLITRSLDRQKTY